MLIYGVHFYMFTISKASTLDRENCLHVQAEPCQDINYSRQFEPTHSKPRTTDILCANHQALLGQLHARSFDGPHQFLYLRGWPDAP